MELITRDIFYYLSGRDITWKKQYYPRNLLEFTSKSNLRVFYLYWSEQKIPLVYIKDLSIIMYSSKFDIPFLDPEFLLSIKSLTVDSWIIDLIEEKSTGLSYTRNEFTRNGELLESAVKMFSPGVYSLRNTLDPTLEERVEIFKEDLYDLKMYSAYVCNDLCKRWLTDHDEARYGLTLIRLIFNTKSLSLCQTIQK